MRVAALMVALTACSRGPQSYAPPRQWPSPTDASGLGHFIAVADPSAPRYIVRDVRELEGDHHRWTGRRPELRFRLPVVKGLKLSTDFGIHPDMMKETGPVTVVFLVNGRELDKVRYEAAGDKHYEKAVPEEWLRTDSDTLVALDVDPVWKSPHGLGDHGVGLMTMGFVE